MASPTNTQTTEEPRDGSKSPDLAVGPSQGLDHKRSSTEAALPSELISAGSQDLHRRLGGKEVQLLAVGGAIGTCMSSWSPQRIDLLIKR